MLSTGGATEAAKWTKEDEESISRWQTIKDRSREEMRLLDAVEMYGYGNWKVKSGHSEKADIILSMRFR